MLVLFDEPLLSADQWRHLVISTFILQVPEEEMVEEEKEREITKPGTLSFPEGADIFFIFSHCSSACVFSCSAFSLSCSRAAW